MIVKGEDAARVRSALAQDPVAARWWLAPSFGGLISRARPARTRIHRVMGRTGMVVSRNLVTENGQPLTHSEFGVHLKFWTLFTEPTSTAGGGEHPPGTLGSPMQNGVLDHIGPDMWRLAQANGHRLPATGTHLLEVTEPVDLVYTWVDGEDPAWKARKATAHRHGPRRGQQQRRSDRRALPEPRRTEVLAAFGADVRQLGEPCLGRHRPAGS